MTNTITKIKNTLDGVNSRIAGGKEWESELEDRMIEITPEYQNKEIGMKRIEESLRDIWDNIRCTNIQIRGSRRREKERG